MDILSPEELVALTNQKTKPSQRKALKSMKITFLERFDGFPIVSRQHIEEMLGVKQQHSMLERTLPDFSSLKNTSCRA